MANSEDVLERAIDWYCDDKTLLYHRGSILRDLIDHVRELRVKLDSEAGHRLSLCADNERFVAEVRELRQKLAEPWRHFPCPETQQPCGRMCLSMCHRRSDLIGELRGKVDRFEELLGYIRGPIEVARKSLPLRVAGEPRNVDIHWHTSEDTLNLYDAAMGGGEGEA